MKEICLPQDYITIVDDDDYIWLGSYTWSAQKGYKTNYVTTRIMNKKTYMHILILKYHGLYVPGLEIDHRNDNGLDNRKENLRIATKSQNIANGIIRINNTSGYTGVDWDEKRQLWRVRITHNGKEEFLGYYVDKHHAARIYNYYSKYYFGEFGYQNNVPD